MSCLRGTGVVAARTRMSLCGTRLYICVQGEEAVRCVERVWEVNAALVCACKGT